MKLSLNRFGFNRNYSDLGFSQNALKSSTETVNKKTCLIYYFSLHNFVANMISITFATFILPHLLALHFTLSLTFQEKQNNK